MPPKECRQFSYLTHKDNQPLELTGRMLGKPKYRDKSLKGGLAQQQLLENQVFAIKGDARKNLIEKIQNSSLNKTNYRQWKNCLPFDDQYGKNPKRESIKTYKDKQNGQLKITGQQTQMSGVSYLISKSTLNTNREKERKHLREWSSYRKDRIQRRHYQDINSSDLFGNSIDNIELQKSAIQPRRHTQSLKSKIAQDLYADIQTGQIAIPTFGRKQLYHANLFRQGNEIGYDSMVSKPISTQKYKELVGNLNKPKESSKFQIYGKGSSMRTDQYRRSSFQFG